MKERPILMNAAMVVATLADIKTVTRRLAGLEWLNDHPHYKDRIGKIEFREGAWHFWEKNAGSSAYPVFSKACPYGQPGDRLWVRESWAPMVDVEKLSAAPSYPHLVFDEVAPSGLKDSADYIIWAASVSDDFCWSDEDGGMTEKSFWRPSIHMPRWASRILLEVTEVRVERLQDISEKDAKAEGVKLCEVVRGRRTWASSYKAAFRFLWDSINAEPQYAMRRDKETGTRHRYLKSPGYGWETNPFVWVIKFRRVS